MVEAVEAFRQDVIIVSGMPRSGTSLMMRMLQAGGIQLVTDHVRGPDAHNPHGYFEDERVKRLARETAWLETARGHAIKVIYRLLHHLPAHLEYRVLFMERNLEEVYASQRDLLASRNHPAAAQDRTLMRALVSEVFEAKQWLASQTNMRCLYVSYAGVIGEPAAWSAKVAGFLGGGLDEAAMAQAVDPALHRHREPVAPAND